MSKQLSHTLEYLEIPGFPDYFVHKSGHVRSFKLDKVNGRILINQNGTGGYLQVTLKTPDNKKVTKRIHKLVALFLVPIPNTVVNHIDGDKKNNDVSNLELITQEENNAHRDSTGLGNHGTKQIDNTSGYVGVTKCNYNNGKYKASIKSNGIQIHLGYFVTAEEAAIAYNIASAKLHVNNDGAHIGRLNEISLL